MVLCSKCKGPMDLVSKKIVDDPKTKKQKAEASTYECQRCKNKETLSDEDMIFRSGEHIGYNDAIFREADASLRLRFTEAELKSLIILFWFSDMMQSVRTDIAQLKKQVEDLQKVKKK